KLDASELGDPVHAGASVVVVPDPEGISLVLRLVLAAVSIAASFLAASQVPIPETNAQERGDETSQTYGWAGIRTEYRSGMPVPLAFGEHDVGGQVIHLDIFASSGGLNIGPNEELRVILALCEGPI